MTQSESETQLQRGDIVLVDFGRPKRIKHGVRPAVVVQNDEDNEVAPHTTVCPASKSMRDYPFAVDLPAKWTGLNEGTKVDTNQYKTVCKTESVKAVIGHVPPFLMTEIDEKIRENFALD